MKRSTIAGSVAAVIAISFLGAAWSARSRTPDRSDAAPTAPAFPAATEQDLMLAQRAKGEPDAPVTIYEASDFQCPYCRIFAEETLPILERDYINTGKVRFIFLNFPIAQLHPNAAAAHEFAMCAAQQGQFWAAHDLLFAHQERWADLDDPGPYLYGLADSTALSTGELRGCLDGGAVRGIIESEAQLNWRAGVRSTPSFIIEGGLLPGAHPIDVWRPILDSIIAERASDR